MYLVRSRTGPSQSPGDHGIGIEVEAIGAAAYGASSVEPGNRLFLFHHWNDWPWRQDEYPPDYLRWVL